MLHRVLLPISITAWAYLGYKVGPHFAPYLDPLFIGTFLNFISPTWWIRIAQWGSVAWFGVIGGISCNRYKQISLLRWQYEIIYFRFREALKVPGNRFFDFIWAYVYGSVLVTFYAGTALFITLVLPRFITKNTVLQGVLAFFLLIAVEHVGKLTYNITEELFRPRELEEGVKFAGFNIDFFQSHRDELKAVDHHQRKGYSSIPFAVDNEQKEKRGERHDW